LIKPVEVGGWARIASSRVLNGHAPVTRSLRGTEEDRLAAALRRQAGGYSAVAARVYLGRPPRLHRKRRNTRVIPVGFSGQATRWWSPRPRHHRRSPERRRM